MTELFLNAGWSDEKEIINTFFDFYFCDFPRGFDVLYRCLHLAGKAYEV